MWKSRFSGQNIHKIHFSMQPMAKKRSSKLKRIVPTQLVTIIEYCRLKGILLEMPVTSQQHTSICCKCALIGHFRVHLSLHFKARLSAKSLLWKSVFIHIEIGTNYHDKNFALRLALKERLRGTRKWPIHLASPWKLKIKTPIIFYQIFQQRLEVPEQAFK